MSQKTTSLPPYRQDSEAIFDSFETDRRGLNSKESARRLALRGPNALQFAHATPLWLRYLAQYKDGMIILLVVSALISSYLGDPRTAVVLVGLVIFNTCIGFFQEYRAEKTMQALERLVQPLAEVYRDGVLTEIESRDLVVGDVVRLSEGDSVPADVRLTEVSAFSTNDFALTGESNPTQKFIHAIKGTVPMANRHNLAYMGTTVATGEAYGVVVATAMNTELGRIADLSQSTPHDQSPLQREISHITTIVTYAVAILASILLAIAIAIHLPFKDALLFAIGFASSLIPQGLPAEVNTSLAQAAGKLSRAKALIKKLSAVESLGATQVICTDKTGTLTKNEMTVVGAVIGQTVYEVTGTGYEPSGAVLRDGPALSVAEQKRIKRFFAVGLYASNAKIVGPDEHSATWYCLGDPTEGALVVAAQKAGVQNEALPEVRELPFDSSRKRMTSIRQTADGLVAYTKGSPESVLDVATHIRLGDRVVSLTEARRAEFLATHIARAEQAYRNLAYASRSISEQEAEKGTIDTIESGLILEGLVSMIDPLREAVPEAMHAAQAAHIAVNIVTGDFAPTALAIAKKAGLSGHDGTLVVISGEELQAMPDDEVVRQVLRGGTIFSRVSPEDKMRIVGLTKMSGAVVAVTGDGINDAPALKRADIGVAMGVTGTDVAKQSAEVILLDDSFSTLIKAIRSGRTIFANIRKGVLSCFTSNAAELVVNLGSLLLTSLLGIPLAIGVLQILAIDLLAELFPIAALGWDKEEGEVMKQRPRNPRAHILNRRSILDIFWSGGLIGAFALLNFLLFFDRHGVNALEASATVIASATTMTYVTIVFCQLLNIMQRRSIHGFFSRYQFHNRQFWGALLLSTIIVVSIVYIPAVSQFFGSGSLTVQDWLCVLAAGVAFIAIRETQRKLTTQSHG